MKMKRLGLAIAATLALASSGSAMAEGFYFGIGGGLSMPDLPSKADFDETYLGAGVSAETSLDDTGEAWGVTVGYRFIPYFAAEVGYVDLGNALYEADIDGTDERFSVRYVSSGPTIAAVGMLPLGERFDIHGRAGIYFADTRYRERLEDRFTGDFLSIETDSRSRDMFAGVGAAWNINDSYSLRLEYSRFMDVGDDDHVPEEDVDLVMFSVLFR